MRAKARWTWTNESGEHCLEDDLPGLHVPVQDVPGLGRHREGPVLVDQAVGDDGAQGGVVELEQEVARHEVPDTCVPVTLNSDQTAFIEIIKYFLSFSILNGLKRLEM